MPARLRHRIDALHITAVARPAARPNPQADSGVLLALGAAIHACELLRLDYAPAEFDAPPRRVQPHHLVIWGERWYLVAWDLDREDWRTFRADRITPRTPTGPRFTPRELPGGDVAAFVANRFQGSDGAGGWPCRGEVILDAPAAAVRQYTRDGIVEELGPNRCRLIMGSWSWPGLAAAIGSFDADIDIVGPAELATVFAQLARRYDAAARSATGATRPTF
ncbi:helix-turn-helix transcriptional regulator [Nocardia sp. NBC_01388]|uniref:helix-turn-helix transcriptional regulator n=1 Tax=Nocardia sp. NBC_01388 TaxID=2903596 RepID=UPI0032566CB4